MSKVRVLVGTRKGAFILSSDGKREKWDVSGPHFAGWEMYHLKGSPVDPNRIYASQTSGWFGQIIQRSDDGGKTWHQPGTPPGQKPEPGPPKAASNKFAYDTSAETGKPLTTHQWYDGTQHPWEFKRVWHLEPSLSDPNTVYAGVEDAALFRSTDGGENWKELSGLRGHGTGPKWQPGAGGMCLHTIYARSQQSAAHVDRDLGSGCVPHRRWRQELEADQQRPALAIYSRSQCRSRPLCSPHRHEPQAAGRALHAEALGRDAQRQRREMSGKKSAAICRRISASPLTFTRTSRRRFTLSRSRATRSTSSTTASCASSAAAAVATSGRR